MKLSLDQDEVLALESLLERALRERHSSPEAADHRAIQKSNYLRSLYNKLQAEIAVEQTCG